MKPKFTFLTLFLVFIINAQDGTLDTTFGTGGKIDLTTFSSIKEMKVDYNDKMVVLGLNQSYQPIIARYNSNGTLDITFDVDGIKPINFGPTDGEEGSFCIYDFSSSTEGYLIASSMYGKIAKIKNDGSFDNTFGTNGIYTYSNTLAYNHSIITYDYITGKVILVSKTSNYSEIYQILPNGGVDTSFNSGNPKTIIFTSGVFTNIPNSVYTNDNSDIFVLGTKANYQTGPYPRNIKKVNAQGIEDTSYNSIGINSKFYPGFVLDASDNSSYFYGCDITNKMMLSKSNGLGNLDTTFGIGGTATVDFTDAYTDNVISINGHEFGSTFKIILIGRTSPLTSADNSSISLARLTENGDLDTTFGIGGKVSIPILSYDNSSPLYSFIDYQNGKLYVMGSIGSQPGNNDIVSLYRFNLSSILSTQEFNNSKTTFFPNPTTSNITFSQEIKDLEIFDITGKKIKSFENTNTTFDVSSLDKGIYLIKGRNIEGIEFNEKLMKN